MIAINKRNLAISAAILGLCVGYSAPAYAQATRTWVSGTGDDVNPCSRTAPCKTFAGAISKTAAGGEISCLDPAGYGAVTITKAMTIDCHYTEGGVLAGGNGIVVNALSTDVVFLRGLDIFGVNPPTNGVRFIAGAALHIEDCVIRRFNAASSQGVSFQPSGASQLFILNTTIADNGNGATGGGVLIQPTGAGGTAKVTLRNVRLEDNANANFVLSTASTTNPNGANATIDQSSISGSGLGVSIVTATSGARIQLTDSLVFNNTTGLQSNGSLAGMRVGNTTITANGTGVSILNSSVINTYGDNRLDGNVTDGAFTQPPLAKK
jgi:hypothetical protein